MKNLISFFSFLFVVIFLCPAISEAKQKIDGVQVINGVKKGNILLGAWNAFIKVDSCTPTLSWMPSVEPNLTYDVIMNFALGSGEGLPERGDQVFYQENIQATSVQITPPLKPGQGYLWSIRTRNPEGQVSSWTTYDQSSTSILGDSIQRTNFWFGIQTPKECNGVSAVREQPSQRINPFPVDSRLAKQLQNGEAGLILRYRPYKPKRGSARNLKDYATLDEFIQAETVPGSTKIFFANLLPDGNVSNEILLRTNQKSFLFFVGKPGMYTLTRLLLPTGGGLTSYPISQKIELEAGKMKYMGDVISYGTKDILNRTYSEALSFKMNSQVSREEFKKVYPISNAYWVEEALPNGVDHVQPQP